MSCPTCAWWPRYANSSLGRCPDCGEPTPGPFGDGVTGREIAVVHALSTVTAIAYEICRVTGEPYESALYRIGRIAVVSADSAETVARCLLERAPLDAVERERAIAENRAWPPE